MSQTDSSSIASALRAGLTDDFLAKASEEADQQSSDSTWAECEKSNGLRSHELDVYGDQVAYEALRSAIVTTLTPIVEQMLAEQERDFIASNAWKLVLRLGELALKRYYPAVVFTGVSGDAGPTYVVALRDALKRGQECDARAEQAERRLSEIRSWAEKIHDEVLLARLAGKEL